MKFAWPFAGNQKTVLWLFALASFIMGLQTKGFGQSMSFSTFMNPVIPGDHPDCTVTRIGSDFYTTGSSFNPTPVIYHSTDLVHWEAIAQPVSAAWGQYGDSRGLALLSPRAESARGQMMMPAGVQGSPLEHQAGAAAAPGPRGQLLDVILTNGHLRARFVDNAIRVNPVGDDSLPGYSGLASLVYIGQGRNLFAPAGLNYECGSSVPRMGKRADAWNAPRVAPMALEQLDAHTVRLTQRGAEAAGLNAEIVYHLGETYVDQTITTWPDTDIESSSTFWASYMLFVQNTSLYLRAALKDDPQTRWLEMTSAGHSGSGSGTYFRPFDPAGKAWYEFLTDNPVRRQALFETPSSRAATEQAGYKLGELTSFDNFFFGFVDDYVALWIFRQPENGRFTPWISATGAQAIRRPAWDFAIASGPQKAGERRRFAIRLVYKPFADVDDVLQEVNRFQAPGAH